MNTIYIALVVVLVMLVIYLVPQTRDFAKKAAPWAAVAVGALLVGNYLIGSPDRPSAITGGAEEPAKESEIVHEDITAYIE